VTVTQPIYTSGKITHAVKAAGAAVTASQTEEVTAALDIKLNVAEAYINVLRAQRGVEIAETALKSLREHERVVGRLVEQGVVVRNDLLAVQVQVANIRQALLATRNALNVARAVYNRALGRPLSSEVTLQEIGERSEPSDVDTLTWSALSQRPETAKISALVRSLRDQAQAVKSGNLPQFFVMGSYNFAENRFLVNEALTTVSIVGDWNFFDSGRNKHKSEQLMQTAEGLIRTRTDVETKIALQVRQAWLALQTAQEQVEVNRAAIESAEENLRVSRNRYEQGTVTNTVVLDAVTLRTGAYDRLHNSVYDVAVAWIRLRRAVGDL
jgi:outer membrane protein